MVPKSLAKPGAQSGRKDEASGAVPKPALNGQARGDESTLESKRLAEPAHDHVGAHPSCGRQPASLGPEHSERVRLVHDKAGVVLVAKLTQTAQVGTGTIHSEVALRHDPAR